MHISLATAQLRLDRIIEPAQIPADLEQTLNMVQAIFGISVIRAWAEDVAGPAHAYLEANREAQARV